MGFAGAGGQVAIGGAVIGSTAGSVLFIDSLGQLAQDNAELFWDDTLNRLGIGTASPAALLETNSAENFTVGILSVRSGAIGGPAFEAHANGALSNFFQGRLGADMDFRVRLDVNGLALGDGTNAPDVTLSRGSVPHAVIGNAALSPIDLEVLGIRSAAVGGIPFLAATGGGAIPIQCGSVHGGREYFFETGEPGSRTEHASLIYDDATFGLPSTSNPQIELVFATAPAFSMIMRNIEDSSKNNTDDELVFLKLAGAVTSTINQALDPTGIRLDFAWTQNTTNWTAVNERLVGFESKLSLAGNANFAMGVAAAFVPRLLWSGSGDISNLAFIWADSSGPGAGNDLNGSGQITNHYGALFDIISAIGEPANIATNRFALWLRAGGATTVNEAIHVEAGVVHFQDELVLGSFINFETKAIPADPATEEARLYLRNIDTDNNALATKMQKGGSIVEQILTPLPIASVSFTVGGEAGDVINVSIQLRNESAVVVQERSSILMYLSDDSNGDGITGTSPNGGMQIGTNGFELADIGDFTERALWLQTSATGVVDIDIIETGVDTWFMVIVLPGGIIAVSAAITFA